MTHELANLFVRDLDKVIQDLRAYEDETDLWKVQGTIKNPAGNLALHIAGNLRHFIGMMLGGSDYQRDRPYEFEASNVPLDELVKEIDLAKKDISEVLPNLSAEKLTSSMANIPYELTVGGFLLHLYNHLGYHAGQLNYHRRMLS